MFKSIEYRLILSISVLILSVALFSWCIFSQWYIYSILPGLGIFFSLRLLRNNYRKYNKNIIFLLNAVENGEYSFHFSEGRISTRERELNELLNRIKDILVDAKKEVIKNEKFLSLIVENVSTGIIIAGKRGNIKTVNRAAIHILGLPVFTHLKQLAFINESFPQLFKNLSSEAVQIKITNEREEKRISIQASTIKIREEEMKIITLNNIGNELEAAEMESWIKLIRVMTHEIMNSIAPITSLSDTLLFLLRSDNHEDLEGNLKKTRWKHLKRFVLQPVLFYHLWNLTGSLPVFLSLKSVLSVCRLL